MLTQALDFREESQALYKLLEPLKDEDFDTSTLFKGWTINDVLGHLHMWNWVADLTLQDEAAFVDFQAYMGANMTDGNLRKFEANWREGISNRKLLDEWHSFSLQMLEHYSAVDPAKRVKWMGPDMSVRSCISARLMETWSHGQEVYDKLGAQREDTDRIRNIVVLGNNTFGWTFINRGLEVPADVPCLKLTAPSGEKWEWNDPSTDNQIEGSAVEFCQVVTQVRNIADTGLKVSGDTANRWMSMAQCFAGSPQEPPAEGSRHIEN